MIKVAITGNIGSGKTEFIKYISKLGFSCISSDAIISKLYKDNQTRKIILEKLKLNDYNYKQEIIRILQNEEFNRKLKKVIYPLLYSKKKLWLRNIKLTNQFSMRFRCYMKKIFSIIST